MVAGLLSCGGCAFFQASEAVFGDGLCRKGPPGVYVFPEFEEEEDEGGVVVGFWSERSYVGWPEVALQDWCGSFVERSRFRSLLRHPSSQKR
jgi:hypothetical protein